AWGGGVGLGHRDAGRQARRGVRERSRPRFLAHRPRCLDRVPPFGAVTGTRGRSAGARTTVQITFGGRRGCARDRMPLWMLCSTAVGSTPVGDGPRDRL